MSNNLPSLLAELSQIAPQICQKVAIGIYAIGDFRFEYYDDTLHAWEVGFTFTCVGNAAYDWLQGALMRVIESKDWELTIKNSAYLEVWISNREYKNIAYKRTFPRVLPEALLATLIQAIKGEQWNKK